MLKFTGTIKINDEHQRNNSRRGHFLNNRGMSPYRYKNGILLGKTKLVGAFSYRAHIFRFIFAY